MVNWVRLLQILEVSISREFVVSCVVSTGALCTLHSALHLPRVGSFAQIHQPLQPPSDPSWLRPAIQGLDPTALVSGWRKRHRRRKLLTQRPHLPATPVTSPSAACPLSNTHPVVPVPVGRHVHSQVLHLDFRTASSSASLNQCVPSHLCWSRSRPQMQTQNTTRADTRTRKTHVLAVHV